MQLGVSVESLGGIQPGINAYLESTWKVVDAFLM